jgi:hypothetical protein
MTINLPKVPLKDLNGKWFALDAGDETLRGPYMIIEKSKENHCQVLNFAEEYTTYFDGGMEVVPIIVERQELTFKVPGQNKYLKV